MVEKPREIWILGREVAHNWREFVISVLGVCSSAFVWLVNSLQHEPHLWQNLAILFTFVFSAFGFFHKLITVYFRNPSKEQLEQRKATQEAIEELVEETVREMNLHDEIEKSKQSRIKRKEREKALLNLVKRGREE